MYKRGEARNRITGSCKKKKNPTSRETHTKGQADKKKPHQPLNVRLTTLRSLSEEISSPMYKLFQLHKLKTKECLSFLTSTIPSLKAMRLRSFQTVQKMKSGMDFQIFPTKEPFQLMRASLTVFGKTQEKPIKEKKRSQRGLTIGQCSKI